VDVPIAVLADNAIAAADGKLSIIGIFDRITAPKFPSIHPSCALVLRLRASPSEQGQTKKVQVRLMDADGGTVLELESEFQVPPKFEDPTKPFGLNQVVQFQGLQLMKAGDYAFHVLINGDEKALVEFSAAQVGSPDGS
jgi:hypothetical protein